MPYHHMASLNEKEESYSMPVRTTNHTKRQIQEDEPKILDCPANKKEGKKWKNYVDWKPLRA